MFESGSAEIPMCELALSGSHSSIPTHMQAQVGSFYSRDGFSVMSQVV